MFEDVAFGDGFAKELRGNSLDRCALMCLFVGALSGNQPPVPRAPSECDAFLDACFAQIDAQIDRKMRWLMLCSAVEPFCCQQPTSLDSRTTSDMLKPSTENQIILTCGLQIAKQVWFYDRCTQRFFRVDFDFADPIFKPPGTLLAGNLLRSLRHDNQSKGDIRDCKNKEQEEEASQLFKTDFILQDVKMWCGCGSSERGGAWLFQQLHVWFNSECWYKRNPERDVCRFRIALQTTFLTNPLDHVYPRGDMTCNAGGTKVHIFVPALNDWISTHRLLDVRLFRLYRTQYPFIYTLMPDNDEKVRKLKKKLEAATHTSLIVTIPTLECERYVRGAFQAKPKYRYRLFYCARFDDEVGGVSKWIPVYVKDC
jgi:hypothetical protein